MIDIRTVRRASRQVAERLQPLLEAKSADDVAELLREAGATDGLEAYLREGLAQRVVVRCSEDDVAVFIPEGGRHETVHRQHLWPGAPLRLFIRAYRAGGYPELLPTEGV